MLVLLALLSRHIWLAAYAHPYLDDFGYAVATRDTTLLDRLWREYQHWNGRWFSNVLVLRGPLLLGVDRGLVAYRIMPLVLMALTLGALYLLIRKAASGHLDRLRSWSVALLGLLLFMHTMPDTWEGFYWYTGAISYQLPNALALLMLALLWRSSTESRVSWWRSLIQCALVAAICGSTEVHMALTITVLGGMLARTRVSDHRWDGHLALLLVIALVAGAIMMVAPGNAIRTSLFTQPHDPVRSVVMSILQTGRFLAIWLATPAVLIASLFFLAWRRGIGIRYTGPGPLPLALGIVLLVFLCMFLPYWSTGLLGQHRTVNVACLVFLVLWPFLLAALDDGFFQRKGWSIPLMDARSKPWMYALLAFFLVVHKWDGALTRDLLDGTARRYDQAMRMRHDRMKEAVRVGLEEIVLPRAEPIPRSMRVLGPGPDPNAHWNRVMAAYYGAPVLRIRVHGAASRTGP